ncbi:cytochrome P450 [Myxococcota bacterium]|nr:cytochrome P450 [Myxococcota bacterium]
MTQGIQYDPFDAEIRENPHPVYRRLRDEVPLYFLEKYQTWAVSRFADVWDLSSDQEHLTNAKGTAPAQLLTQDLEVSPTLNTIDPPEHSSLRATIRSSFLPRKVKALEGVARDVCREQVDQALATGHLDVVRDFGSLLSATVVCHVLGLPVEDGPLLTQWVQAFFTHDPDTGGMTPEGLESINALNDYCVDRLRERRQQPGGGNDPLSVLSEFQIGGRRYSDEEAASHFGNLIVGGTETFPKLLASAMLRFAEYPHFREQLRDDPTLIPDAFDEVLRYDMPTQFLGRSVVRGFEHQGVRLEPGQKLIFLYPSANRDEREFPDPDVFDIRRRAPRIVSFGTGQHQCIGRHIARMEGRIALEALLPALGDYEVDFTRAVRLKTEFVQGYGSLPISFEARR